MKSTEKQVDYRTSKSYSTLNQLTAKTKNVWIVCHGIGYLSRYFLKYFNELSAEENYIIAPQAPSKYYLTTQYKHIGASWLTKENTANEIENICNYLDAVYAHETIPENCNLIVFGYSQGVSVAARWVAKRKVSCQHLVFHSGSIPQELAAADFSFLRKQKTQVTAIVGDTDEYLTPERLTIEIEKLTTLFGDLAKQRTFNGGHVVHKSFINQLVS